jgi:hypothetical protein
MKSLLFKSALLAVVGCIAASSVYAGWQCRVHNAKGQYWYGTAPTRAGATANAMKYCVRNSVYASNCIVDYCKGYGGAPVTGTWKCTMTNSRGQVFVGTGPTRSQAAANVSGYCAANSVYARNCVMQGCSIQ